MARGPVHEAYASLTTEAAPTQSVDKKPPAPIEEMPPAEKPAGEVVWISGYWSYDDDRKDFLWVSGLWRSVPPGKEWVAGYWREEGDKWQWVPGFWTASSKTEEQQVSYLPDPPKAPNVAPPGAKPTPESFWVPGCWVWNGATYAWRAGYWAKAVPGYVWVNDHFRWTPSGYIYVAGYWDYALKTRGILYAPVVISPTVVTVGFVYTPAYAVRDTVVVDAMFVRPCACSYYFGDYYEVRYRTMGFESAVVYSQRNYEPIVVYECYERRSDPTWLNVQVNLSFGRSGGTVACPPRTLADQTTIVNNVTNVTNVTNVNNTNIKNVTNNNFTMIAPAAQVASAKGTKLTTIDNATRMAAKQQAQAVQQVAYHRSATEKPLPPGSPRQARVASYSVPKAQPVKPGMVAPKPKPMPAAGAASGLKPVPPRAPTTGGGVRNAVGTPTGGNRVTNPHTQPRPGTTAPGSGRPGTAPPGARPGTPPGTPPRPGTVPPSRVPPKPQPKDKKDDKQRGS
jgi:hypothetical protein